MALWVALSITVASFAGAAAIMLRGMRHARATAVVADDDAAPVKRAPVKRRRRVVRTAAPPPPPPLPDALPADAAPAEQVSFDQLIGLIETNLETNNLGVAAQYLEELRARFMDNPPADYFSHKLLLAEKRGDPAMAAEALEQLVRLEPDVPTHLPKLVEAYITLQRMEDAERILGEALALRADDLPLLKLLATLYRKEEKHEEAVALKQRIHALEQELRLRGELPPDPDSYAPPAPPQEPPAA